MEEQQDLTSRIKSYIKQDNFKEALLLSRAHSQDQGNHHFKFFVGLSHKLLGQLEEALNVFEDFEEEQYQNIDYQMKRELLLNMGDIYFIKQLYAKSGEYYSRLLDLKEDDNFNNDQMNCEIFDKCIQSFYNIQNFSSAQKIGFRGSKRYPNDLNINLNYAKSLSIKKNYKESIKLLEQFIQKNDQTEAKLLLADTYYHANMLSEAEKINQQILNSSKDFNEVVVNNLAKIKFSKLDFSETQRMVKKGFEINPNSSFSYYYQGMNMYLQGDIQEAIPQIEMACTLDEKQDFSFPLSLIIMYIEKGYLTQNLEYFHNADAYLKRDEEETFVKQTNNCLKDNPLFQYTYALILRLIQQPHKFEQYWTQMFHISALNFTPLSKHPSQDIYDKLDEDTQHLLCLIPQIDFFATSKPINSKCEAEIEYQKTLLLFQILKIVSIPSMKLKKQKYIELTQLIRNLNKYQQITSEQFQNHNNQQSNTHFTFQSQIHDQSIALNVSTLTSQEQLKQQKKDKAIEEFNNKFMEIAQNVIEFAYSLFKNGFHLDQKVSNYTDQQLIDIILLSTVELEEYKKIGDLSIDDLNLPQKARRIIDLNTIGGGYLFKESLQIALNSLDPQQIKSKLSKKDIIKKDLQNLNAYKIKEDLFIYKSSPEALAYDYAYKFFTSLLIDNQPSVKYYSYTLHYYQTYSQQEQTYLLHQVFKSLDSYSHKCMRESFIRIQKNESEKCCVIF